MKSEVKEEIQPYIRYINENDLRDKCEEYIQMFFFLSQMMLEESLGADERVIQSMAQKMVGLLGQDLDIDQPQRKASEKEKNYAKNRLDGVIKKIMKAMTAVQTVKDSLLQPKTKAKVVNEIKEKARPSIMSRLAEKKKELAEREANKKNDLKKSWNRDDR